MPAGERAQRPKNYNASATNDARVATQLLGTAQLVLPMTAAKERLFSTGFLSGVVIWEVLIPEMLRSCHLKTKPTRRRKSE